MAKRTEKFPEEIYVDYELDGESGSFLIASATPEGMGVTNDERRVAVYQFVRVAKLVNKTEVISTLECSDPRSASVVTKS